MPSRDALADAYERGLAAERAGDLAGAAAAFAEALALDPSDPAGLAMRLAAMGRGPTPPRAPAPYVATLFDQNAEAFERILVGDLGYRTPQDMAAALAAEGPFARMLDLGCGTGLCGRVFGARAGHVTGVDLSEGMLAVADASGAYDELFVGDAEGFLEAAADEGETWDLIVAADMLPYLGDLEPLFARAADRLAAGGLFIASTEAAPGGVETWAVGAGRRFVHADAYALGALRAAGLRTRPPIRITVRCEGGAPAPGALLISAREGG